MRRRQAQKISEALERLMSKIDDMDLVKIPGRDVRQAIWVTNEDYQMLRPFLFCKTAKEYEIGEVKYSEFKPYSIAATITTDGVYLEMPDIIDGRYDKAFLDLDTMHDFFVKNYKKIGIKSLYGKEKDNEH